VRSNLFRRALPVLAAALLTAFSLLAGPAGAGTSGVTGQGAAAGLAAGTPAGGGPVRARVTGAAIHGTSTRPTAASGTSRLPSKKDQIKVLTAVLKKMHTNYAKFADFTPGPTDIFDYGIGSLWRQGIDGAGTTIALMEGWNFPQIGSEVSQFDQTFGLPGPPSLTTIFPSGDGKLPATCPHGMVILGSYGSCDAWQGELALDVITAHLIAPYAKIVIAATPADSEITGDPASNVAMPEIIQGIEGISRRHLANVISISDGTGETTYSAGQAEITAQNPGELAAAAAGIPVLVGTGDCGVVQNLAVANAQCNNVSATPDTAAWDDSPWVTAVGGSVPNLNGAGKKAGPDPLWHDGIFSEGAGYSSVFGRPAYQNGVRSITRSPMRSVPDITMDAQDGTSESAPMMAGVLALATQANHANVGPINPALYQVLGPKGTKAGIADVLSGNNSAENSSGQVTVPGFTARKGFDVASGWGTINAAKFVPSLVAATRASHQARDARKQALTALTGLRNGMQLSAASVPHGGTSYLLGSGFLPSHPVTLAIDGKKVTTLAANPLGVVTYMIAPARLGLAAGRHTVTLTGMLLTQTAHFRSS
jgi:subtilase family serine protease